MTKEKSHLLIRLFRDGKITPDELLILSQEEIEEPLFIPMPPFIPYPPYYPIGWEPSAIYTICND